MCDKCGRKVMIYWLKDDIWKQAFSSFSGFYCPTCFEEMLGRALTLNDVDISNYKKTMPEDPGFMREYTRALAVGGLVAANLALPANWSFPEDSPHKEHMEIGRKLGTQTPNPREVAVDLVNQVQRHFP